MNDGPGRRRPDPGPWIPADILVADRRKARLLGRVALLRRLAWAVVLVGVNALDAVGRLTPAGWPSALRTAVAVIVVEVVLVPVEVGAARLRSRSGAPRSGPALAAELATTVVAVLVVVPATWLAGRTPWWWLPAGAVAAALLLLRARAGSPAVAVAGRPAPDDVAAEVLDVAALVGVDPVPRPVEVPEEVPAAAVEGLGRQRRLVLTAGLAAVPESLRRRMVAHELVHHRRRHPELQAAASVVGLWAGLAAVAVLAAAGVPWRWFGVSDPWSPEGLPLLVLVVLVVAAVVRLPLALLSRDHEWLADVEAARAVPAVEGTGPTVRALVDLQVDLDPSPPWSWWSPHPPPAVRLALLEASVEADERA